MKNMHPKHELLGTIQTETATGALSISPHFSLPAPWQLEVSCLPLSFKPYPSPQAPSAATLQALRPQGQMAII